MYTIPTMPTSGMIGPRGTLNVRGAFGRRRHIAPDIYRRTASSSRHRRREIRCHSCGRTDLAETEEGYALSKNLLAKGYVEEDELKAFPAARASVHGVHPVIECTQNIPCNPCQDACKFGCILVGKQITNIPVVDREKKCTGCGMCVASCSGQALFLVNDDFEEKRSTITLAYEFLPYPEKGQTGHGFDIGPIAGLLLSELLLDGKTSTLPIDAFRYDRF